MKVPQSGLSYDEVEADPYLLKRSNGERRKLSPVLYHKSQSKAKNVGPAKEVPVFRTGDELMKFYAFNTPFGDIARCNPKQCPYGGMCVGKINMDELMSMKEDFWGKRHKAADPASERRRKIEVILRASYVKSKHDFEFFSTNREQNNRMVCEAAFLIMLGLSNKSNASEAPSQWRRVKQFVQKYRGEQGGKYSYNELAFNRDPKRDEKEASKVKFENCVAFISYFVKHNGETVPDATGISIINIALLLYDRGDGCG